MIENFFSGIMLFSALWGGAMSVAGEEFRLQPEKYWNIEDLVKVPAYRVSPFADSKCDGLQDILVTGIPVEGKSLEFFAYIGYPSGPVPYGGFPGIVLIHGGGGTAYPQYVKHWTSNGYVVIALDWYYQRPLPHKGTMTETSVKKVPLEGGYRQNHVAVVGNIVLSHSLLRSLKNVNPDKTAFVGLSWGSWYGAMVAAVDPRFKGGIEIYCGAVDPAAKHFARSGHFHHACKVPMYWIVSTNDQNVTPQDSQRGFDECAKLENKSIVINLQHSHIGFLFPSCMRMADFFLKGAPSLPKLGNVRIEGQSIHSELLSKGKGIKRAILCYTTDRDEKISHKRKWKSMPAKFNDNYVWADLPKDIYQCFLSAYDDSHYNDLCGSSNLVEF